MTRHPNRATTYLTALFLTAISLASTVRAGKGNGGKPGSEPPTGTIYFEIDDGTEIQLASMNADGSGKTLLPAAIPSYAVPSYQQHNGVRWFLTLGEVDGQFFPDGSPVRRLEAIREDGAVTVSLFQDSSISFSNLPAWSRDDGLIAISAVVWDDSVEPPAILGTGLYVLAVSFDETGPRVTGGPLLAEAESETTSGGAQIRRPIYGSPSFSPDGTQIVYVRIDVASERSLPLDIVVTDLVAGDSRFLAIDGHSPEWSPNGSTICFRSWHEGKIQIQTIDANDQNESTRTTLIETRAFDDVSFEQPGWSPTGQHIVYIQSHRPWNRSWTYDVYRMSADGKGNTNLTKDTDEKTSFPSWR